MVSEGWIAGVDGCPAGWIACLRNLADGTLRLRLAATIERVLDGPEKPVVLAIDMPMGLAERAESGGRLCERAARAVLKGRASCVFATPSRDAVYAADYREALRLNRGDAPDGRGLSRQAWNIVPKIRELDGLLLARPDDARRIHEAHPEMAFARMNGGKAVPDPKRTAAGREKRLALLRRHGFATVARAAELFARRDVGWDDILDAAALCRTAGLIHAGEARREPAEPSRDRHGLVMAISW